MPNPPGARENKRRETHARIAAAGLKLFLEHGYDATTLDAIAQEAGISRRTFFYYFASKDDVLLAWNGAGAIASAVGPAIRQQSPDSDPLEVASRCLIGLASRFETPESKSMDALIRSSGTLRIRKDAEYFEMEQALVAAFEAVWPEPARVPELRMTAMVTIGTLRLALDDWRSDVEERPLAEYLQSSFAMLTARYQT